jgi:hypothetical protein
MPQANDGELTRLITVHTGGTVEDPAPNTPPPGSSAAEPTFDLHLEGVAGNVLGSSGATYTLTITALDLTAGAGAPGLSPGSFAQSFSESSGWHHGSVAAEFVTDQVFTITVPGGVSGHVFMYTASLVSTNFDQAWLVQSNPFVLC